eukprot:TRINITY_DN1079_c1_g1_i1.p1 TRINITY_DN1079_c1_g1~~TRINITY_DN1079_c1_g1_i1.p1  ORF type:complete len:254 (+),score=24.73 TRINITY_DN1079_c1_g1_i1:142-903(+)
MGMIWKHGVDIAGFLRNSGKQPKFQVLQQQVRSQTATAQQTTSPLTQLPTVEKPEQQTTVRKKRYARASLSNVKIARSKLEWAAHLVRRMHIDDALVQVELSNKKACRIVKRVLLTARANAVNNHSMNGDWLIVDRIWTGRGNCKKRLHIHGRGYSSIGTIYYAHLWVILREVPRYTGKVKFVKPWWERDQIRQMKMKEEQDKRKAQWGALLGESMGYFVSEGDGEDAEGEFKDEGLVELEAGESEEKLTKDL